MNRDEQKQILALVDRAVNGTPAAPVWPMDVEADAIIRALFVRNPEAAYRVTMLAIAQAQALDAAQAALVATDRAFAPGFFARLFKRSFSESPHEQGMGILERPING